ncbi:MAG: hypothetical protein J6X60_13410, partial [Ruminiclostridium sp.]|nr:hypothetical protein [Ruminiclostridium sp.]
MLNRFIGGGLLFSYCTARRLNTAEKAVDGLEPRTPVIVMSGALIYDPVTKEYPVRNIFDETRTALLKRAVTENGET